jgi:hypothetical protein
VIREKGKKKKKKKRGMQHRSIPSVLTETGEQRHYVAKIDG